MTGAVGLRKEGLGGLSCCPGTFLGLGKGGNRAGQEGRQGQEWSEQGLAGCRVQGTLSLHP